MKGLMECAVFKGVGNIVKEIRPIPECPKGGLLVKVYACGICGSDVRNFRNGLKGGVTNQIMGHEIAGEVVEVDADCKFKVGDRVALAPDVSCGECWYCKHGYVNLCQSHRMLGTHFPGGFAQYLAVPEDVLKHGFIEHIPDSMPYSHAAFAETAAAVVACQKKNGVKKGDRVVIIGDGPVGCLHAEIARSYGAETVIIIGMDKLDMAKEFNPDALIKNTDVNAVTKQVVELCGGVGADIVINAVPTVATLPQALNMVRKRGTVVIYGGVPKTNEIAELNSNLIHYSEITVTGAFSYPSSGLADALDAIADGSVHPEKYINAFVTLDTVVDGMEMVREGKALKVIIDPWKNKF